VFISGKNDRIIIERDFYNQYSSDSMKSAEIIYSYNYITESIICLLDSVDYIKKKEAIKKLEHLEQEKKEAKAFADSNGAMLCGTYFVNEQLEIWKSWCNVSSIDTSTAKRIIKDDFKVRLK